MGIEKMNAARQIVSGSLSNQTERSMKIPQIAGKDFWFVSLNESIDAADYEIIYLLYVNGNVRTANYGAGIVSVGQVSDYVTIDEDGTITIADSANIVFKTGVNYRYSGF